MLVVTAVVLTTGVPVLWPELYSERAVVLLLATYVLIGLSLFILAFVAACCLVFVVTDKRAVIRFSFWGMTTDGLSIEIEAVRHIEINSYGDTYGSVYLNCDNAPPRNSKRSEPYFPQPGLILHARNEVTKTSIPIKRFASTWGADSIWSSMSTWRRLLGFYGFKGFDEFAAIISEQ